MSLTSSPTTTKSVMKTYSLQCSDTGSYFFPGNQLRRNPKLSSSEGKPRHPPRLLLHFGISLLHAWIQFFECFLQIGYKLGIKKWQAHIEDEKKTIADRKKAIQKGFKDILGLKIDFPKQGFVNTNDGNTARYFFEDESSAQILKSG